jgi:hypothetical protein
VDARSPHYICALDRLTNAELHPYPAPTPGDPVEG